MEARGPAPVKSAAAFRTISEVSAELDVPQHVLRFWETKFPQIRPLKRGGGRRYYRPDDVVLLRRIQTLLYKEGYTIKGVQRLLKETRGLPAEAGPDATDAVLDEIDLPEGEEGDAAGPPVAAGLSTDLRRELRQILDELLAIREQLKG